MGAARQSSARWIAGGLFALTSLSSAHAGGFLIRDHSAAGFGMAIAGVASGDRLSYSFWNPAVLGTISAPEFEGVATGIFPSVEIMPDTTTNAIVGGIGGTPTSRVDIGRNARVPAAFAASPLTQDLVVGLAITSPFGLATEAPRNWAGQAYSRTSEMFSLNANPMMSYRINDKIAVGAGVQFQYFDAHLTQASSPFADAPDVALDADDLGIGFTLGLQLRPVDGTTIGIGYRSSISHDLEGTLQVPGMVFNGQTTLETPDVLSIGLSQRVTDRLRVHGTIEWDNWSRVGTLPLVTPEGTPLTSLYLNYRDGWLYSVGAEYDATAKMTVRAGLGYEVAPLSSANRDTRFPEADQVILSAGLSYKYNDRVTLDFSYLQSIGVGDSDIEIGPDKPSYVGLPFYAASDLDVSIVSAAISVKFDGMPSARLR
ncbi:OmpP1/FadL family transporter [Terrihabitans sp. B22-R8]|uniref:OmpP1/FadL family transporter n=1 Tax=Terrihabitans sp. B22-R8 TaxID=3425128 RepID=UPI00403C0CC8